MDKYDACTCLDLTALQDASESMDEPDHSATSSTRDYSRLLLVVTSRGVEFLKVPKVLH